VAANQAPSGKDLTPPAPVSRLKAKAVDHGVSLVWVMPSDRDLARVEVTRSSRFGKRTVYSARGRSFVDRGLTNGFAYRYAVVAVDTTGNASAPVNVAAVPRSAALVNPRAGAAVTAAPKLRWKAVKGAGYYNIQLFHGTRKILSVWPRRARFDLSYRWRYGGARYRLTPGVYHWYVWPGVGPLKAKRYGKLLGDATFAVVPRKARTAA
jgi:hypothetical protein